MKSLVVACLFVATFSISNIDCARLSKPECTGTFLPCLEDCTKYYLCLRGRLRLMPCPDGLHWNNKRKICDQPEEANCVEIPKESNTTPAPQPDTTTTTTTTSKPVTEPVTAPTTVEPITTITPSAEAIPPTSEPKKEEKKVICYFTNWSWHRLREGKYVPEDIDPNLCTHIIFAYAVLDPESLVINASNPYTDVESISLYKRTTIYRENGIKVLLGLGGLSDTVGNKYERLLTNENSCRRFIASVMAFIYKYEFDGLDIEYPVCLGNDCGLKSADAKQGFAQLLRDLSKAFKPNEWLLSVSVTANAAAIHATAGYDVPQLNRYCDWISLMTQDYYSNPDNDKTELIAPLHASNRFNIDSTVKYWIQKGAAPDKLVLGIPTHGLSFTLEHPENHGLSAPSNGPGKAGPFTSMPGTLAFYEICNNTQQNGWTVVQSSNDGPYAYHGDQWVSFDNVESIRTKAKYIHDMNLGGGMIWTLDFDDFKGKCGCGNYPLLTALNQAIRDEDFDTESLHHCA